MSERIAEWRARGRSMSVGRDAIFVVDQAAVSGRSSPPIVFLHGYPTCSFDYRRVFDHLPDRRRVTFDFLGFGLSDKPASHVYSLFTQADLAEHVVRETVGDAPFLLVAHDMATSVTTELLARAVDGRGKLAIAGVLLLNGSMVLERASLTVSQRILRGRFGPLLARASFRGLFRAQLGRTFSRSHPLSREEADDGWDLLAHAGGNRILDKLTYYLHERMVHRDRWHGALRDWPGHLELAWALRDPVCTPAVLAAVRALRPRARVTELPALGHYPQIEDPAAVTAIVEAVYGRVFGGSA